MTPIRKRIAVLPGDGIGPEVTGVALRLLEDCATAHGHKFEFYEFPFGGAAIDACGSPLPKKTLDGCRSCDAILLGAVGGPKWDSFPLAQRPEAGLLSLRKSLDLYINVRPIRVRHSLHGISPLKIDRVSGCDFEIVRELAGDIYFGAHEFHDENGHSRARDIADYSSAEVERVARYAFRRAAARSRRLASVDKANVLATSTLWRKTVTAISREFPEITAEHLYVDNAAMQIILRPKQFDIILTSNLFGDILSDEAAAFSGSIGLIPSMSCGSADRSALYEPIHGSAPTLAGKDVASPLGAILSVSMMLRESFGLVAEARWIESAVDHVLEHGYRTMDIAEAGCRVLRGSEFGDKIRAEMHDALVHTERYGWGV